MGVDEPWDHAGSAGVDGVGGAGRIVTHPGDESPAECDVGKEELPGEGRVDTAPPYEKRRRVEAKRHSTTVLTFMHGVY